MIKILKNGVIKKPTKTIFTAECSYCCCEFEFEVEDVLTMEKSINGIIEIRCPYCGRIVCVPRLDVKTREEEVEE